MSVSAINNTNNTTYTSAIQQNSYKNDAAVSKAAEDEKKKDGVVYEKGTATSATKKTYAKEDVIARLKKDAEDRTTQLRSLVQQMMVHGGRYVEIPCKRQFHSKSRGKSPSTERYCRRRLLGCGKNLRPYH